MDGRWVFAQKENLNVLNLNSNFLNPLPMCVFYDSSCTKQAKHIIFPQVIFKNQQCRAALIANYQNRKAEVKTKGINKPVSLKVKSIVSVIKADLPPVLYHEREYHPL